MMIPLPLPFTLTILLAIAGAELRANDIVRQPQGDSHRGYAWTVTTPDVPLAFTTQLVGSDESGRMAGDAAAQTRQAIANLRTLLRAQGSGLNRVVKLNAYVTDDHHHTAAAGAIGAAFADFPVPVSFVRTRLAAANALVAIDAVAQAAPAARVVSAANVPGVPPAACGAHVAVLPAGRRVFLSGYASRSKAGLRQSLRDAFESQRTTLAHHGMSPADVVQVKAWLAPLDDRSGLEEELAAFFGDRPVPPVVMIEWPAGGTTEIEFILSGAMAKPERFAGPLAFDTRPGAKASTRFSHVAFVEAGQPLIFITGLYGRAGEPVRAQLQDIFAQLGRILFDAGSGFRYLAKATYHNVDGEGRRALGEIRDVYFDPARPPAASGVVVHGVGKPGCTATLDMIAVPLPKP